MFLADAGAGHPGRDWLKVAKDESLGVPPCGPFSYPVMREFNNEVLALHALAVVLR
ncbi:hypothetical protein SAMN04487971_109123 [Paracoccus chinensis]|uniref:Uncharacterized protein n=1 Tax=Paracoccus chinensis TaxID=525640 RepID=A0A1G9JH90_9RHOB|nr:hypothetical protein SAMN04487971_109123 [Paracoccus chinensis]